VCQGLRVGSSPRLRKRSVLYRRMAMVVGSVGPILSYMRMMSGIKKEVLLMLWI